MSPLPKLKNYRSPSGQSMIVLVCILSFFILAPIGLFCFELSRVSLATQQLKNALDAAALTAAATLANDQNPDTHTAQQDAIDAAYGLFKQNTILGRHLDSCILIQNGGGTNQFVPGTGTICFSLVDPQTGTSVSQGDPRGKIFSVSGSFCDNTAFGKFIGVPQFTIGASSLAEQPKLDVVLCFDTSASMDDQTDVTLVNRHWDATTSSIVDTVMCQGGEFNVLNPASLGSPVAASPPMNLARAFFNNGFSFSEFSNACRGLRALGATSGQGTPDNFEQGLPPGNYPPGTASVQDSSGRVFTDLVVNLDGNTTFGGTSKDGFDFPDVATLVEAQRGNLENSTVFKSSKANTIVHVAPKPGYQAEYYKLAAQAMHPIYEAKQAAEKFIKVLSNDTRLRVSLVCFSDKAGAAAQSVTGKLDDSTQNGCSGYGPQGVSYPIPFVQLDSSTDQSNTINSTLDGVHAFGGTDIGDAISTAVDQLAANGRPAARKVIVLFTDGVATVDANGNAAAGGVPPYSGPESFTRNMAAKAKSKGYPVYTIGLAQNTQLVELEYNLLNDQISDPTTGGISGITGGRYYPVTNASNLGDAFGKIARELVQLVGSRTS